VADIFDDLLTRPQRETAGSDTSSRFDYQKDWVFCQMLRRHMEGADYLVAFEFHDDVVFLERNISSGSAEFFQVKTSKSAKPCKLASLISRHGDSNSIEVVYSARDKIVHRAELISEDDALLAVQCADELRNKIFAPYTKKLSFTLETTNCWQRTKSLTSSAGYNARDPFTDKSTLPLAPEVKRRGHTPAQ
jgi:hypothetical protein